MACGEYDPNQSCEVKQLYIRLGLGPDSRLRQLNGEWREAFLGGVTRYVLDHADLPVLMRH